MGSEHGSSTGGISFLTQDPDELIAEDDLFFDQYHEAPKQTVAQKAAAKEADAHRHDVLLQNRKDSVRALIWYIAEGGVFPPKWSVPSKQEIKKMGSRGMEKMLSGLYRSTSGANAAEEEDDLFHEGWAGFANDEYRVTVFSKVSFACLELIIGQS